MTRRGTALAICAALLLTVQAAPVAWADRTNTAGTTEDAKGGKNGRTITVQTKVRTSVNGDAKSATTGNLSSADSDGTPPACWYEPAFSPREIEKTAHREDDLEASACDKQPFWVDEGKTPDEPLAVTPRILAE
ncbi:hypothetical protein [Streptomyces sp. KN37]|uniref:hypothetical protein n=1 Tax=Streptomyces sp. KN37 TaxID=3090667 RepID=UPI002A74BEFD|nr:hypothetical protein [Streptomyces sp. KN37]WPO73465.1 hypothetical protein R9806_23950 [Streptomyces sp. KN37]